MKFEKYYFGPIGQPYWYKGKHVGVLFYIDLKKMRIEQRSLPVSLVFEDGEAHILHSELIN